MKSLAIIDYGMGNLRSVEKALAHLDSGHRLLVTGDAGLIAEADRVIFPGVGAIRDCMAELKQRGLVDVVRTCAATRPFLGICLGMQALMEHSDENDGVDCLGVLPGQVRRFRADLEDEHGRHLKVPHMGWNQITQTRSHPLWRGVAQGSWFYFVHSYYVAPDQDQLTAGSSDYGVPFTSAVARGNVFALQCHPEKSQHPGLKLLENFLCWDGERAECGISGAPRGGG